MGFFTVLGIIFIVLKLCGVIFWSWWLVLLPLYGGVVAVFLFVFISAAVTVAWGGTNARKNRMSNRWKL